MVYVNPFGLPCLPVVPVARGEMSERRWSLQNAGSFVYGIARKCLTAEEAHVRAEGETIVVHETPACAEELEHLSKTWLQYLADPIVVIQGTPERLSVLRELLANKYGPEPGPNLTFLSRTQHCACLVMTGKRATDATALATTDTEPKTEPTNHTAADPFEKDEIQIRKPGLIWQTDSISVGGKSKPLLN